MPDIVLRGATPRDSDAVASLVTSQDDLRQVSPRDTFPVNGADVDRWRGVGAAFVLSRGTEVLAYGEINRDPTRRYRYWIGHVVVSSARRNAGLGKHLISALTIYALDRLGAGEVWIGAFDDNPAALRCYLRCGFEERSRRTVLGRTLVDLSYRQPMSTRVLSRRVVAALSVAFAGLSTALLPAEARLWTLNATGEQPLLVFASACAVAGILGWILWYVLPRKGTSPTERYLMPMIHGVLLAMSGVLCMVLLVHAAGTTTSTRITQDLADALPTASLFGLGWGTLLMLVDQLRVRMAVDRNFNP